MNEKKVILFTALTLIVLIVAGCGGETGVDQFSGAIGPQEIPGATEVLRFDPAELPPGSDTPFPGACVESASVPGSYRCEMETDFVADPCFALSGTRLICNPNPAAGTYGLLVSPQNALPPAPPPSPDRAVAFFVELEGGLTCAIRTAPEPVILDGVAATYDCNIPYTYLVGDDPFDRNAPTWTAVPFTLDPATGQAAAGVTASLLRAWIP